MASRRPPRAPPASRPPPAPDVHELLKREMFASRQAACDDHFEKQRPCPAGVFGVSDHYLVLDTFLKKRESDTERGRFRWNFMVQGVTSEDAVGVRDRIETVIEIQVGSFAMPNLPEVPYTLAAAPAVPGTDQLILVQNNVSAVAPFSPTLVPNVAPYGQYPGEQLVPSAATAAPTTATPWINNPYSQLPNYGRFTVQIEEAGSQSYSDRDGARHNFEFAAAAPSTEGANPNMLIAKPVFDTYTFTRPLPDIHGISLVFRNPDIPIKFLPDCLYDVLVDDAGAPPYLHVDAQAHGLNMGDRIFISGFRSGNPALDAYVNRAEGLVAAGDPAAPLLPGEPIGGDTFWTDPAISTADLTVNVPDLPQRATVCIAKRRMRIPLRIRTIKGELTNYITP